MKDLIVGIDETGSMGQMVDGWRFVILPSSHLPLFEEEVKKILNKSKLKTFHAKKFARRFQNEYKDFLALIKEFASSSSTALIGVVLNSEEWKKEYIDFAERLLAGVFKRVGIRNQNVIAITKVFAGALLQFQELTNRYRFPKQCTVTLLLDSDDTKRKIEGLSTIMEVQTDLKNIIPKISIDIAYLLKIFYEKYRERQFPNSPRCKVIRDLNDEDSFIIQAADVIGNFSLSYIFCQLGKDTKSNNLKASIYDEIYKDIVNPIEFFKTVEMVGDDLKLKIEGLAKLVYSTLSQD